MTEVQIKQMYDEIILLRKDVQELKECFHEDILALAPETVNAVKDARKRMKKQFVSNEEMRKEFEK